MISLKPLRKMPIDLLDKMDIFQRFFLRFSNFKYLISGFPLLISLTSCDLINPAETAPAYLQIASVSLNTTPAQGSASEKISEAWVFLDDQLLGAFAIPSTIPVLAEGQHEIRIEAGIRENGISSTPDIYPFYQTYTETLNFTQLETEVINAQIGYQSQTRFSLIESFEGGNAIFRNIITGTPKSKLEISNTDVFEGNGKGIIQLATDDPFVEIATVNRYKGLLDNSNAVFLELNYRSDIPASFGIVGYLDSQELPVGTAYQAGFNPSEEWNKIYFNLTPIVFNSNVDALQIVIKAGLPINAEGTFDQESGLVELDNIKLVHF